MMSQRMSLLGLVLSVLATLALIVYGIMLAFQPQGDWDFGWYDVFKTPLGAGFYLLAIDSPEELPLPLCQRDSGDSCSPRTEVTGLACQDGRVFLRFDDGYAVIQSSARQLVRLNSFTPRTGWLGREGWEKTSCANPPQVVSRALQGNVVTWGVPLTTVLSGIFIFLYTKNRPRKTPNNW